MGNPLKRRAVTAMVQRWKQDERRIDELFGEPRDEFSDEAEMLRNIGTAIAYAERMVTRLTPQDV